MRVLIVRVGAMGDVLHALPAAAALRRAHPEWRIDWAVEPRWGGLLVSGGADGPGPVVDGIVPVRTQEWKRQGVSGATLRDVLALRKRLRAVRYDLCVDLQGSIRSAVIGWMAGARQFVGTEETRERPARWLYQRRVKTTMAHVVEQGCEVTGGAIGEQLRAGRAELPMDEAAEHWCDGLEVEVGRFAVFAPGAGWGAKEWPAERFGEVAKRLAVEEGWTVLVNAVPGERATADAMVRASGGAAKTVECSVAQLTALLRRAALLVGGDTGPLHLADVLGVSVVALFGPTDPARTGPSGVGRRRVLRHASSGTDHRRYTATEVGLMEISVEEVTAACLALLRAGADE